MRNANIRCNELRKVSITNQNTIVYNFVNEDNNTPTHVRISLGDIDPITGNPIEDIQFFREYRTCNNRQAARNNKHIRMELSQKEKEERNKLKQRIAEEFEEAYGYAPTKDTLQYLLEEKWPLPYVMPITIEEEDDFSDSDLDYSDRMAEAEFPGNESDDTAAMQEFAKTLSGRLLDVYRVMLERIDAGSERPLLISLAAKWNISPAQINKDQEKIRNMIRDYSLRKHRFSYDQRTKRCVDEEYCVSHDTKTRQRKNRVSDCTPNRNNPDNLFVRLVNAADRTYNGGGEE